MKNIKIPVLSIEEQQQISDYLDYKTLKIDTLIEKTQQKIELLKEQRTSLINTTVTKGLNPNVEMKDSRVEWIGEIPSEWEVVKLKFVGKVVIGLSYSPDNVVDEGEGTLVMRSTNVQNGKPSFHNNVYVNKDIPDRMVTREGDILICSRNGSRNLIGKNCIISKDIEGMTFGVFMTIFRSKYLKLIYWVLNSPVFKSQSGLYLTSTINQLTVSTIKNLTIPFTFNEREQQQIVDYLDKETSRIDKLVDIESKRIYLLKEYRQSLISEVVTGKVDVRDEVLV
jgi:type I restriction enzyme S subunit